MWAGLSPIVYQDFLNSYLLNRYKMPKMVLKQESRLNGVKTNIFNLEEVAKALRVPEEAIIKFLCAELGASKEKTTILKGQHNYDTLLKFLDK